MAKRKRTKEDRELDRVIEKINKLKPTSAKAERRQTARVKAHDVTASEQATSFTGYTPGGAWRLRNVEGQPDPWLVGMQAKLEGKDPVKAINKSRKRKPKLSVAERINRSVRRRKKREREYVEKVEAAKQKPIRREIPMPQELTTIMAPPLPKRKKGSKPNIVSLIYAFRAFQQYSHAFTRRSLGDPASREVYYQTMKERFHKAMTDAGLADQFDWSEF